MYRKIWPFKEIKTECVFHKQTVACFSSVFCSPADVPCCQRSSWKRLSCGWSSIRTGLDVLERFAYHTDILCIVYCMLINPTVRLPSFDLHRRQWSLLNRFRTRQGHCNACHKKWGFTDNELCDCGETQTMSHIVNSCPLTKFNCGLLRLHEADEAAVDWLTTYGS